MSPTVIVAICSCVVSILALSTSIIRNSKTDSTESAKQDGTILTEIGYIKSSVEDVKKKLDKQEDNYVNIISRLSAVEQSSKQAHKRLDRLEKEAYTSETD